VACGFAYTAVVTSCGQSYAWGAGENGRLGVGDEQDRNKPTRMLLRSKVRVDSVCAGSVHTCVLSKDGEVYSFGKHEYTGHGSSSDILVPRKLDAFNCDKISQLSVGPGGYHTIALTAESGKVYTWGHNRVGQLGFPISDKNLANAEGGYFVPKPTWVTAISDLNISTVVAGWGHSAVVTENGEVHTCGRNFQGQLGLGEPDFTTVNERGHPYQSRFRRVQGDLSGERVAQFACGGEHSIALSTAGQLYSFGKGHKGQLGLSSCETRYLPTHMRRFAEDGRKILQVACGNNCTLVLRGRYRVPSLFELCRRHIQDNSCHGSAALPPLVDSILKLHHEETTEDI
jgi:alpha-tubulin suppressor-like RCC1 family protein